jgi:predicted dienelactone hydrolase
VQEAASAWYHDIGGIMKRGHSTIVILVFLFFGAAAASGEPRGPVAYSSPIGPYGVKEEYATLVDASRGWDDAGKHRTSREIPIKIYAPEPSVPGAFPVVLVSHGLGGSADEALAYMAEDLAAHGYIVVAVQHHRSDDAYLAKVGRVRFLAAAGQPETRRFRPQDMIFALDWLSDPAMTAGHACHGRMDLSRVGLLGHSFGAWATLACLGQVSDGVSISEPRFLCGVAYSPQGPGVFGLSTDSWKGVARATFTMGGTKDTSPGTDDPADRRAAFDSMPATGTKYHATLKGAEHSDFGNNGRASFHGWIEQMTLAFFDGNLRGDAAAKAWLDSRAIEGLSSKSVSLEMK